MIMKNKPQYFCLYLEPYTYIVLKKNHLLLYNTLDSTFIEEFIDKPCRKIFSYFITSKCYSQAISAKDTSEQFWKIIQNLRKKYMGDYYPIDTINDTLHFSFPFYLDFNLQKTYSPLHITLQTETDLQKYINTLCICPTNARKEKECINIYYYEYDSNNTIIEDNIINKIDDIIKDQFKIVQLPGISSLLLQFEELYGEDFIINQSIINCNYLYIQEIKALSKSLWMNNNLNIYINLTYGFNKSYFIQESSKYAQIACFHFLIENKNQWQIAMSLITVHSIERYQFSVYFNHSNLDFFKKHVYISEKEILKQEIKKQDLFINMTLNKINFGKLFIFTNGSVYSAIGDKSLGNLKQKTIKELVFKEMAQRKNWLKTRNKKPCKDCIYQYLCPPPSKYEEIIGHNNLCHVKQDHL